MGKWPSIPEVLNGRIMIIEREDHLRIKMAILALLEEKIRGPREKSLDIIFAELTSTGRIMFTHVLRLLLVLLYVGFMRL
jgi:hypothetical protein